MEFSYLDVIQMLASGFGFLLFLLIWQKRRNKSANIWVSFLMLALAIQFLNDVLYRKNVFFDFPGLGILLTTNIFLLSPLHFLYAKFLINSKLKIQLKDIAYFTAFLVVNIFFLKVYFSDKTQILEFIKIYPFHLQGLISLVHSIGFLIATLKMIGNYRFALKQNYTSTSMAELKWLYIITISILVFICVIFVFYILADMQIIASYPSVAMTILFSSIMFAIGYYSLNHPEVFILPIKTATQKKYASSGLTHEKRQHIKEKLEKLIYADSYLFISDLNIVQLADKLNVPPNYLSQIINEEYQQNFYNFINGLRIEEVKKRFINADFSKDTIIGIAYDVGFSSKSVFYNHFKKNSGMTPGDYIKTHIDNIIK